MNLISIATQKCPRCGSGKMFKGIFAMHENCSHCELKFDRAEGYYTMAIVIANFMYALVVASTMLIMTTNDNSILNIVLTLCGISLIAVPLIFRYARTIWLHLDFFMHPE